MILDITSLSHTTLIYFSFFFFFFFFFYNFYFFMFFFFFFQAEDGIRDGRVTGVQTCALPISPPQQNVVIDLRGVNFKFDRPKKGETNIAPTLKPPAADSVAILDQAVDTLNRYPQVQIEIDGYTDSVGTDQYNQGLSERRANIVDQYLTSHGIDSSRITAVKGFGENDPIDTNKTAAGRQRNRRVEFKVEGQGMNQDQQQQQQ